MHEVVTTIYNGGATGNPKATKDSQCRYIVLLDLTSKPSSTEISSEIYFDHLAN